MPSAVKYLGFLLLLCTLSAHASESDSVALEKTVHTYYMTRSDSVLRLLDEAEARKVMASYRIDQLRAITYGVLGMPTLKETCLRRALHPKAGALAPRQRLQALTLLVNALQTQGKYSESLQTALQGIALARELGNTVVEYYLLNDLGEISFRLKQTADGYAYLEEVIRRAGQADNARELSQASDAYGLLMEQLASDRRYAEAVEAGRQRCELLARMKGLPGPPPGYFDQQEAYVQSKLANLYQLLGQAGLAEEAYRAFLNTGYAKHVESGYSILPYLKEAGRYREVLQKLRALQELWQGRDTIHEQYCGLLQYEAEAAGALNDFRRMAACYHRASVLADSIYAREKNSRAQELATVFKLNEKEQQLREIQAEAQRRNLLLAAAGTVLTLLAVLVAVVYANLRRVKRRNRIAVRQIDELLEQREELRRRFARSETAESVLPPSKPEGVETPGGKEAGEDGYAAFMRMERVVVEQQLFLQSHLNRDDLLRLAGIRKNDLPGLLKQHAGAANLNDYLNRLRVEYSVSLMKEKGHLSMEGIAEEAGFNSRSTFYRVFYKEFGVTPIQYMKTKGGESVGQP